MNEVVVVALFLIISGTTTTTTAAVRKLTWWESSTDDDRARYCRICESHTMCLFPYDDPGQNCVEVENGDLADEEIEWILHKHNSFRDNIARARKSRDPWPPARDMMQVIWDEELARIARRWALQCNIHDKDQCRDVGRFTVLQNVNALDMQDVGNHTALERLEFHMKTWYDEVDLLIDALGNGETSSRSVGLAAPSVTNVGCGRATYNVDVRDEPRDVAAWRRLAWIDEQDDIGDIGVDFGGAGRSQSAQLSRVETLVCNYGPIDGDDGEKETGCETPSRRYTELCRLGFSRAESRLAEDEVEEEGEEEEEIVRRGHRLRRLRKGRKPHRSDAPYGVVAPSPIYGCLVAVVLPPLLLLPSTLHC